MREQAPGGKHGAAIQTLQKIIAEDISQQRLTGVSVALVDDQTLVYAGGFGLADAQRKAAATADTVYRTGSISKLFNAVAVMQLVEEGRLDLDAPVTRYDPEFSIVVPFVDAPPITLRHLLCHRSGMIREAPVGSYFDGSGPTTEACVHSTTGCVLVNPPGTKTRYSNVGATLAGHIVAKVSGTDYEAYQQAHILGPLGMKQATFRTHRVNRAALATGYMEIALPGGGFRRAEAPTFELGGTIPAGNLYATASDVARLAMMVFGRGRVGDRQIIRSETLEEMLRPQLLLDEPTGFGLGFNLTRFGERALVSHNGALYGFSSTIALLPEVKLGVVALANDDIALGPVRRIVETALELMLEAKVGEAPASAPAVALSAQQRARFAGEYVSPSFWASVRVEGDGLQAVVSGQALTLTPVGPLKFVADGKWQYRAEVVFTEHDGGAVDAFQAFGQAFRRVEPRQVRTPPPEWQKFVGSYGPPYCPLVVSMRHGDLYAFTENMLDYRLTPVCRTVFALPPGLYTDEQLVFQMDAGGEVHGAILASVELKRQR